MAATYQRPRGGGSPGGRHQGGESPCTFHRIAQPRADLTRERAHLEDLLERRWGLLSDEREARVEQPPPVMPGMLHSRRDALVVGMAAATGAGVWALVGAVVVLVLRAS